MKKEETNTPLMRRSTIVGTPSGKKSIKSNVKSGDKSETTTYNEETYDPFTDEKPSLMKVLGWLRKQADQKKNFQDSSQALLRRKSLLRGNSLAKIDLPEATPKNTDLNEDPNFFQNNVYGLAKHQVASQMAASAMLRLPLSERLRHPEEEREKIKAEQRRKKREEERQKQHEEALESEPGFLAAKLGGLLDSSLLEREALRKKRAEGNQGGWRYDHPARVRLRKLNFEASDLLISEAKKRSQFYNQFLDEKSKRSWEKLYRDHLFGIYERSQKNRSVSPTLAKEVRAYELKLLKKSSDKKAASPQLEKLPASLMRRMTLTQNRSTQSATNSHNDLGLGHLQLKRMTSVEPIYINPLRMKSHRCSDVSLQTRNDSLDAVKRGKSNPILIREESSSYTVSSQSCSSQIKSQDVIKTKSIFDNSQRPLKKVKITVGKSQKRSNKTKISQERLNKKKSLAHEISDWMPANSGQQLTEDQTETSMAHLKFNESKQQRRVIPQKHIVTQRSLDDDHLLRNHRRIKKNAVELKNQTYYKMTPTYKHIQSSDLDSLKVNASKTQGSQEWSNLQTKIRVFSQDIGPNESQNDKQLVQNTLIQQKSLRKLESYTIRQLKKMKNPENVYQSSSPTKIFSKASVDSILKRHLTHQRLQIDDIPTSREDRESPAQLPKRIQEYKRYIAFKTVKKRAGLFQSNLQTTNPQQIDNVDHDYGLKTEPVPSIKQSNSKKSQSPVKSLLKAMSFRNQEYPQLQSKLIIKNARFKKVQPTESTLHKQKKFATSIVHAQILARNWSQKMLRRHDVSDLSMPQDYYMKRDQDASSPQSEYRLSSPEKTPKYNAYGRWDYSEEDQTIYQEHLRTSRQQFEQQLDSEYFEMKQNLAEELKFSSEQGKSTQRLKSGRKSYNLSRELRKRINSPYLKKLRVAQ